MSRSRSIRVQVPLLFILALDKVFELLGVVVWYDQALRRLTHEGGIELGVADTREAVNVLLGEYACRQALDLELHLSVYAGTSHANETKVRQIYIGRHLVVAINTLIVTRDLRQLPYFSLQFLICGFWGHSFPCFKIPG